MTNQVKNKRGQKYDTQFKEQVLQKVRSGQSVPRVAVELGISEGVIYQWQGKLGSDDKRKISDLEKENTQLRTQLKQSNRRCGRNGARHLKKSYSDFCQVGLVEKYEFVKREATNYPIKVMCNTLIISKNGYYTYTKGESHKQSIESGLSDELRQVFQSHKRRYGSRRLHAEMREIGYKVGRHGVRKLLKEQGLKAIQPHSFVPKTTNSKHGLVACPNLLGIGFEAVKPNQAWVSDITYIPLKGGKWAYLAAWTDIYTRRIVSWAIDISMTQELVIVALNSAIKRYKPSMNLILHSDRGGQYFGLKFRRLIDNSNFDKVWQA